MSKWPHSPFKPCWESRAISWRLTRKRYGIESSRAGDLGSGHVRLGAWGFELFGLDLTFHSAYSAVFGKLGVWVCLLFPFSSKKGVGN